MCLPSLLQKLNSAQSCFQIPERPQSAENQVAKTVIHCAHVADLTHPLSPQSPVYPNLPPFVTHTPPASHASGSVSINHYELVDHCGTHLDAPYHCYNDGWTSDTLPLSTLIAPAVVINIGKKINHDHDAIVTPDDILNWERSNGKIPNGAAVLMASGWANRIHNADQFINADSGGVPHFPGFGVEAIQFLLNERNINGIGVDTLSLDHGASPNFAVHYAFLPSNKWGIECLANLESIPPSGATLVVAPWKVVGSSGGPVRVMAMW
jgi:kynurenine formamidase